VTTCEPGAREVLTHGLESRPASTAFLASRPAPTMTYGFEVLVHEVIAAITTAPWSSSNSPASDLTVCGLCGREPLAFSAGASEPGKDSSPASSWT
jgi:hypothetical protein